MALSIGEIKKFIADDKGSERKKRAAVGNRYYNAEHDILKCRLFYYNADGNLVEDKTRSNIKIVHPFFIELCDQLSGYMLSFDENPIRAKEKVEGLQDFLDQYFDDEFWAEVEEQLTGTTAKGFDYIFAYKNEDNKTVFQYADGMNVVEVSARDADDKKDHIIYSYEDTIEKGKKTVTRIQDVDDTQVYYYIQIGDSGKIELDPDEPINPRPHVVYTENGPEGKTSDSFGFIPFWRLDYNKKQISALKPIKGLIDDYDLHACSLSNNLKDFDTPLHVVSGFQGDNLEELQTNLKTKKIVGVDAEGDVQIRTVEVPYEARKAKLDIDEKNIYRFGMGLNTSGLKDTNATTNIAIKTAYALLDMKANKLEKRLKKMLKQIIKVVLDEINKQNKKDYQLSDIEFKFTRSVMTNETENIQNEKTEAETQQIKINTILNIAANVGDDQTLKAICDVMDWDFDEIKKAVDQMTEDPNAAHAKALLEGVVVDDPIEPEPKPKETDPVPPVE